MPSVAELLQTVKPEEYALTIPWTRDTLGRRGRVLPMGKAIGGAVVRDFAFRRPDTTVNLEVGEVKAREDLQDTPGAMMLEVLRVSLDSLMGVEFHGTKAAKLGEQQNLLRSLAYIDVVYLVFYRAMERRVLRKPFAPSRTLKCPSCHADIFEIRYDLPGTIFPVWDWTPDAPPRAVSGLTEAWGIGAAKGTRVVQGPPAWHQATCHLSEADWRNDAAVDVGLAAASVVAGEDGVEGGVMTTPHHQFLGSLPEWDKDTLMEASRHVGGEILPACPFPCPACAMEIPLPMSWRSVGFF